MHTKPLQVKEVVSAPKGVLGKALASMASDFEELDRDIELWHLEHGGHSDRYRQLLIGRLKQLHKKAQSQARLWLNQHGKGHECALSLCGLSDRIMAILYYAATKHVFPAVNPTTGEQMALVGVGGYGRGMQAPFSDIDLLIIVPYRQTAWTESVAEFILYALWDLGLKVGHAVRSPEETVRQANIDLTIRTSLLEHRFLLGHREVYEEFARVFEAEVIVGTSQEFIVAKLKERDERHQKLGDSRYFVEPNIKEGKGGLRDLHLLYWLGIYVFRVRSSRELIKYNLFSAAELQIFEKSSAFLWTVRCHMHFISGRAEEKLGFEMQREIASILGYEDNRGLSAVERFMKHYFLVAKDVGNLTRIVCAALEYNNLRDTRFLARISAPLQRRRIKGEADFVIDHNRLNINSADIFDNDPVNLIRMFHIFHVLDHPLHPHAVQLASRKLKLIDGKLRKDPLANRLFLEILTLGKNPEPTLRIMNETGVLGRFIPAFGRIVALMQFNMYHHYTVDEHLIRAMGFLWALRQGQLKKEHPLSTSLVGSIASWRSLCVAVFLHDIAKGMPEDHSVAGAKIAQRLCPRLGLSQGETETVAWLVRKHLVMSDYAQRRDLADPKTIENFSQLVQSPERLKLLLILTVVDIRAVGPGVWNGWKGELLRTLYYETEPVLGGGHVIEPRAQRMKIAKEALQEELDDFTQEEVAEFLQRHYPAYWLKVDVNDMVRHARMLRKMDAKKVSYVFEYRSDSYRDATEITVIAGDHPTVLSCIAGACTSVNTNILEAQSFTTSDGLMIAIVLVSREEGSEVDVERRMARINQIVGMALSGETPIRVALKRARPKAKLKAFRVKTDVLINNSLSNYYTVIEAKGIDRPGLLYDLSRVLSSLNLDISSAHIATYGEEVVDVFYVTDLIGGKILSENRQEQVQKALMETLNPA